MTVEPPKTYASGGWIATIYEFRYDHGFRIGPPDFILPASYVEKMWRYTLDTVVDHLPIYNDVLRWAVEEPTPIYNQLIQEFA
jgi:hypothetical protein